MLNTVAKHWCPISLSVLAAITFATLAPLAALPEFPGSDKTHHLVAYALLIFPIALRLPKHWVLIAIFFAAWGGAIELIQPYVNRYGEWQDLLANCIGLLIGVTFGILIGRLIQKDSSKQ